MRMRSSCRLDFFWKGWGWGRSGEEKKEKEGGLIVGQVMSDQIRSWGMR